MVTDRYIPQPVPDWSEIIAKKDEEIMKLKQRIKQLEELLYAQERQAYVDMGR